MRYSRVRLDSIAYELPPNVVTSEALEDRLEPLYKALRLQRGQLEALTGIRERRWWNSGFLPSEGAIRAARRALEESNFQAKDLGVLVYAGVCRDNLEPATACAVGAALGLRGDAEIYDVSNACLGVMNAIVSVANRIELGQIRAGMIVSCESSREIINVMIEQMLAAPTMEMFKLSLATLTGGSGAVALILSDELVTADKPRLLGGAMMAAPEHHALCRWGEDRRPDPRAAQYFETDAISVLKHGVELGARTWEAFLREMKWADSDVDRVILHQVGAGNRAAILQALKIPAEKEYPAFEYLGNMGTVSLPLTAALATERGFIRGGDLVGFLGIGSGLNCLMLGWEWRAGDD
ncbi:3-oxoacyl-ACP synthase III [Candidatus Sumerlaeota bacterium]|nr:3-oxoacyl-ACP synthase III [Candidatus Sumerlaeota bacterium]MBI3735328.1 3-oxoacyl-ACP synthase III [Candidatus Sumerlaeota bacterium]